MAVILKGAPAVKSMKEKMLKEVEDLKSRGITPCLAIVRLGDRPDDIAYERGAVKRMEDLRIKCILSTFEESTSQEELIEEIKRLNCQEDVHGILIFRPLPKHINEDAVKDIISPQKDVDCMSPVNVARVFEGDERGVAPCTPEAVIKLLENAGIELTGKRVVVIGRSLVVGKPLAMLLLKKNATVTICHTKTKNLQKICRECEILIAAAGKAKMVTEDFVSPGQVIIDVGINVDIDGSICGDVDYEKVEKIAGYITPVPGGVGSITTSVLAEHVMRAAKGQL